LAETNSTITLRPLAWLLAKTVGTGQHLGHHGLLGGARQPQVDETRTGDFQPLHPALHGRLRLQCLHQRGGQFTRVLLQRPGHLHGRGDGQVAMAGLFGGFENRRRGSGGRPSAPRCPAPSARRLSNVLFTSIIG
jgi:hypothetical protein